MAHIEISIVLGSKHWLLRPFWLVKWSFSHAVGPWHLREKKAAWQHRKAFAILTDTSALKTTSEHLVSWGGSCSCCDGGGCGQAVAKKLSREETSRFEECPAIDPEASKSDICHLCNSSPKKPCSTSCFSFQYRKWGLSKKHGGTMYVKLVCSKEAKDAGAVHIKYPNN